VETFKAQPLSVENLEDLADALPDPQLKRQRKLYAIKARQEKKYVAALESIENYWAEVNAAIEEKK
jgi:hypothetical protein